MIVTNLTTLRTPQEINNVVKNTLQLLGLSLLPTILGSWIAMIIGVPNFIVASPIISMILFFSIMFGLLYLIHKFSTSTVGVLLVFIFTFFMGIWLSGILSFALAMVNGWQLIAITGLGTASIVLGCSVYAMQAKRDFSKYIGLLFGSIIALIVVGITNILFFQLPILALIISGFAIIIFSFLMIYDVQRIINGGESNYIIATISIYLNIYNIFSSLLHILLAFFGQNSE